MKYLVSALIASSIAIPLDFSTACDLHPPTSSNTPVPTVGVEQVSAASVFVGRAEPANPQCATDPNVRTLDGKPVRSIRRYDFTPLSDQVDTVKVQIDTRFYKGSDLSCAGQVLSEEIKTAHLTLKPTKQRVNMSTSVRDKAGIVQAHVHRLTLIAPPMSQPTAAIRSGNSVRLDDLLYSANYFTSTQTSEYLASILEHDPSAHKTVVALISPTEKIIDPRRAEILTITH